MKKSLLVSESYTKTTLWPSKSTPRQKPKELKIGTQTNSVQFSHSVVSNSLQPHGLQHTKLPSPSPTPGVYSNSCPLNWWCHSTISSSVIPFSCLQSFPASGSFHKWVSSSHHVAKVSEFQLQHQSFQWTRRTDLL